MICLDRYLLKNSQLIVLITFLAGVLPAQNIEHYPFTADALGLQYTLFIEQGGYRLSDISTVLADEDRLWFRLPASQWRGMQGELQGMYDKRTGLVYDLRFIVYSQSFAEVVELLAYLYPAIDSQEYLLLDRFYQQQPEWLPVMVSRLNRRLEDQQLALFVTSKYRIEVWRESFLQSDDAVAIIFRPLQP
jgi:hypothetical protein